MPDRPRILFAAAFLHGDPERKIFKGKTLQFFEQQMVRAVWRAGGLPVGQLEVPEAPEDAAVAALSGCAGLLLQGGADCAPESYAQSPLDPRWSGDRIRDLAESRLIRIARARGIPVLGICRGAQILNVACGGSLVQDIPTQREGALAHREFVRYDRLEHPVRLEAGSFVHRVYGREEIVANSVHHQAVDRLADGFRVTASAPDGIIEAIEADSGSLCVGVQWHPEWLGGGEEAGPQRDEGDRLFAHFVEHCRSNAPRSARTG